MLILTIFLTFISIIYPLYWIYRGFPILINGDCIILAYPLFGFFMSYTLSLWYKERNSKFKTAYIFFIFCAIVAWNFHKFEENLKINLS